MMIVFHGFGGGRKPPARRRDTAARARRGRMQHPAILPWPSGPPVIGRANGIGPSLKSAAASLPDEGACIPQQRLHFASAARLKATHNSLSGGYPAARSMICNVLHRCERDNQEVGDAET